MIQEKGIELGGLYSILIKVDPRPVEHVPLSKTDCI